MHLPALSLLLAVPALLAGLAMQVRGQSSECPNREVQKEFYNMLTLPVEGAPNKISFRSCISRTSETVLADIEGPGCVKQLWLVTGMGNEGRPSRCVFTKDSMMMVIRVYYDGATIPSVEAPLGALFGMYHDQKDSWGNTQAGYGADNTIFKVSENGAYTLMAPMPFAKSIRITLQNENPEEVKMRVWSQTSYTMYDPRCPFPETLRFHAVYRMENRQAEQKPRGEKSQYKRSYTVGHAQGSGYLLGATVALNIQDNNDQWFHNGAEMIIVDQTTNPRVMKGTGGEDFFGTSCWFEKHHNFDDWGFLYGDNRNFFSAYRFFTHFQMPFKSELQFMYGANRDFVQSVMYWYQREPAIPINKKLPSLGQRLAQEASDPSLLVPAPSGSFEYWNATHIYDTSRHPDVQEPPADARYEYLTMLRPSFGFLSIGEYFFTYNTNEGYPLNKGAWLRSTYEHEGSDGEEVTLVITHDDPHVVRLNGAMVYHESKVLSGIHTFLVKATLKKGVNVFEVKTENTENTNTRAWVFGLAVRRSSDEVKPGMFGKDVLVQQRGNTVIADGACE